MQKDERDLLEVLKFELEFLEKGGYGRSPKMSWRPQYIAALKRFPAATFRSTYPVRRWILCIGTAIKTRPKKQLEAGLGQLFSVWKNNGQLLDRLTANSHPPVAER